MNVKSARCVWTVAMMALCLAMVDATAMAQTGK